MTQKIKVSDLPDFDFSEHLDSEAAIAEYLTVILEDNDPSLLAAALGSKKAMANAATSSQW